MASLPAAEQPDFNGLRQDTYLRSQVLIDALETMEPTMLGEAAPALIGHLGYLLSGNSQTPEALRESAAALKDQAERLEQLAERNENRAKPFEPRPEDDN